MDEKKFPPVTQVAMISLALIIAGGIYLSANLPAHVALGPAVILLALSSVLMAFNLLSLTRVKDFAWDQFFAVAKWSLLAYIVIAGMIEFADPLLTDEGGAFSHWDPERLRWIG